MISTSRILAKFDKIARKNYGGQMTPVEAAVVLMLAWVPCNDAEVCIPKYTSIAKDTFMQAKVDPLPWPGLSQSDRADRTAVLLLAIGSLESLYDESAVSSTGDHCFLQVHPLGKEDVSTRQGCLEAGLSRVHWSWISCRWKSKDWLSPFKTGVCYQRQKDARVNLRRDADGWSKFMRLTSKK